MIMLSATKILQSLQGQEANGVDLLFQRYYKPLVVFAESYLHDLPSAEDLVQEQIIKLWSKKSFDRVEPNALTSFLFTVIKNACINCLEKKKLSTESLDSVHYQIALEEAERLNEEALRFVRDALEKLPDKTRQVVIAVMLDEKMYKEAAVDLGVSVNTVKTLLKQGLKELKGLLKDKRDLILYFHLLQKIYKVDRL